jgi:hypothetical protein
MAATTIETSFILKRSVRPGGGTQCGTVVCEGMRMRCERVCVRACVGCWHQHGKLPIFLFSPETWGSHDGCKCWLNARLHQAPTLIIVHTLPCMHACLCLGTGVCTCYGPVSASICHVKKGAARATRARARGASARGPMMPGRSASHHI